jgi:hypothetical protein
MMIGNEPFQKFITSVMLQLVRIEVTSLIPESCKETTQKLIVSFKIYSNEMLQHFGFFARSLERGHGICATMIYTHVQICGPYGINSLVKSL